MQIIISRYCNNSVYTFICISSCVSGQHCWKITIGHTHPGKTQISLISLYHPHRETLDDVFYNDDHTAWMHAGLILISDILAVEVIHSGVDHTTVLLHHVVPQDNRKLKVLTWEIAGDTDACNSLKDHVDNALKDLNRPSRLLVFVNPESGHKKGLKIYNSKVAPLFKLCGIHTNVIVTEGPGQPRELLASSDLRLIHGIVAVGGDGMYSECVNGLLERLQSDAQVNIHDPQAQIRASKISLGIIPAGSGNYLVNYIHGTHDIETATIKIILGDHLFTNVVSVHQGRRLQCYSSLLLEFGLIGEMMHDCEKYRWMGPNRYNKLLTEEGQSPTAVRALERFRSGKLKFNPPEFIPITTLFKRKPVDVEIDYLPSEKTHDRIKFLRQVSLPAYHPVNQSLPAGNSCKRLNRLNSSPDHDKQNIEGWKKMDGSVYGVDTYVVTQKSRDNRLVPFFGDSALSMWVTDKCSLKKHVQQLTKFEKGDATCWDYEFIRRVRTSGYRVKLTSVPVKINENGDKVVTKKYYINADGEAIRLESPEFEIRLHKNAIPIFGKIG